MDKAEYTFEKIAANLDRVRRLIEKINWGKLKDKEIVENFITNVLKKPVAGDYKATNYKWAKNNYAKPMSRALPKALDINKVNTVNARRASILEASDALLKSLGLATKKKIGI